MSKHFLFFVFSLFFIGLNAQNRDDVVYLPDDTIFPNPGRGFYHADDRLDPGTISEYPKESITLVFREYHIDEFKDTKIPVSYLWKIKRDLNNIRNAGLKVILRFRYTARTTKPYGDAPLNIVLMHIKQLEPILRENSDVILTFQAGFIGAWGEWYYTDYFSEMPGVISEQNWLDRKTVVDALLESLPSDIMVNVRTPNYKKHLLQAESYIPVTEQEAYSDSPIARISHHNDCFLATSSDMGTYRDTTIEKPYLAEDAKYTVIGGETCGQSSYSHCENALKELKRFHWSYLNRDYHTGVIGDWISEGCYPEIQKKLGYRYRLVNGEYSSTSNPEGVFLFKLNMVNEGYANPSNPMDAEIILRSVNGGQEYVAKIDGDLRFWPLDDTIKFNLSFGLPENIYEGVYDVYLRITDVNAKIKGKPSYSIRFANADLWDESRGYNKLNHTLTVSNSSISHYFGGNFFDEKDKTLFYNEQIVVDGVDDEWWRYPVVWCNANQHAKKLKVTNNADSLYFLIKGEGQGDETEIYIDADNNAITGWNSFDYKITCCKLYYYTTSGQWNEIAGVVPVYVGNQLVKELGMSFTDFSQVAIEEKYGVKVLSGTDYLPGNSLPSVVIHRNTINGVPVVEVENQGNINTICWNRNLEDDDCYAVVTRFTNGQSGEGDGQLAILPNYVVSYQDKDLNPGEDYEYFVSYLKGNNRSLGFPGINMTAESDEQAYIDIKLNGSPDDWKLCKPVATREENHLLKVVRFFNNSDSLFYSLKLYEGAIEDYQLMLNLDGLDGFEYMLRNDSLFCNEDGEWSFIKTVPSFKNNKFLEAGLKLSEIGLDSIDYFTASAFINRMDIWGKGEEFSYLKYPTLSAPANFQLKVSSDNPYHRIKVKWGYDKTPDKYVIERSTDDSLHFSIIAKVKSGNSYYLDDDVDSSHVYYYRMFSYTDIIRSAYTEILWMRPGVSGVNMRQRNSGSIEIFPNPVHENATIIIKTDVNDYVTADICSLQGKTVQTLFEGSINGEKHITFNTNNLPGGLYLVKVKGKQTFIIRKIVIR